MSGNPFLDRERKANPGVRAEKKTIKRHGIQPTVASGQVDGDPGDGKTDVLRYEVKTTQGQSFSIKEGDLNQIYEDAISHDQQPIFAFQFVQGDGTPRNAWVAMPEKLWLKVSHLVEDYLRNE